MTIPERGMPPLNASERETADGWLDYYRATLLLKCQDLDDQALRSTPVEPSALSLQGLVQHLAAVERNWFRRVLAGEDLPSIYPDGKTPEGHDGGFEVDPTSTFADAVSAWQHEVAAARANCLERRLSDTAPFMGTEVSLRWVYQHMTAEYARHCGHADLLRERIDGVTGV
ncbi:DinB family protein [Arthrobacter rhombi]|uniref:DinB family protein n=1 Tax=Arthrobacter rhombi TaxID=71253 RepID=UPI0031D1E246